MYCHSKLNCYYCVLSFKRNTYLLQSILSISQNFSLWRNTISFVSLIKRKLRKGYINHVKTDLMGNILRLKINMILPSRAKLMQIFLSLDFRICFPSVFPSDDYYLGSMCESIPNIVKNNHNHFFLQKSTFCNDARTGSIILWIWSSIIGSKETPTSRLTWKKTKTVKEYYTNISFA